jgi:hypothetical protein
MAPTLTAVREQTYDDTLDDEMEMLEVAQTLKGRLADIGDPTKWRKPGETNRLFEEHRIMRRKELGNLTHC